MTVKQLTEHHLEFLSLKGNCTGSSESTLCKIPHCRKSHVAAHILITDTAYCKNYEKNSWYYFDDSSVSESDEESTVVCIITFFDCPLTLPGLI